MSYGFDMSFTSANTLGDAMVKANEFVSAISKPAVIKDMLEKEKYYIPSLRFFSDDEFSVTDRERAQALDDAWLQRFLSVRFVYWPAAKLLGLVGAMWTNQKAFFPDSVYFQNSCDQDYDLDSWPVLPFFDEIVKRHRNVTAQELLRNGRWNDYTLEELNKDLDYYARTDTYAQIYSMLGLDDWLWGHSNDSFVRFTLSALHSDESRFEAGRILRNISQKEKPELWKPLKTRKGWIPCDKLMPEKSPEVKFYEGPHFTTLLATCRYADSPNVGSGPTNYTKLEDGSYEWSVVHTGMADEVLAWMPMPKPFNG